MTPKDLDVPSRGVAPKASWIWHPLHENSSRDGAEKMSGTTGLLGRCLFGLVSRHSPNAVEKSDLWRIHFHIGTRARKPFTWSAAVRFFCRSFFSRKCLTVIPWFKYTLDKYGMPRVDKKATDTDNQMSKWFVIPRSLEFSIYTHGTWTLSESLPYFLKAVWSGNGRQRRAATSDKADCILLALVSWKTSGYGRSKWSHCLFLLQVTPGITENHGATSATHLPK